MRVPAPSGAGAVAPQPPSSPELMVQGSRPCPGCGKSYPPSVQVCVQCGINVESGAMLYASLDEQISPVHLQQKREAEEAARAGFFKKLLRKLGLG